MVVLICVRFLGEVSRLVVMVVVIVFGVMVLSGMFVFVYVLVIDL